MDEIEFEVSEKAQIPADWIKWFNPNSCLNA